MNHDYNEDGRQRTDLGGDNFIECLTPLGVYFEMEEEDRRLKQELAKKNYLGIHKKRKRR